MARHLVEVVGSEIYCDTSMNKKMIDEEQMLDIAEVCFIQMADVLIKRGVTVKEAFGKYAVAEVMPESKMVLELLAPEAFFEAVKLELNLRELSDIEVACLMRVLAKPELQNAIILNEFALILENFGVPLIDGMISEEEDFVVEGEEPHKYDLKRLDLEGLDILVTLARHLL